MRWSIHKSVFEAHCNGRFIVKRVLQCNNRGCITLSHQLGAGQVGAWAQSWRSRLQIQRAVHHSPSGPSHRQVGEKIIKNGSCVRLRYASSEEPRRDVYPSALNNAHMKNPVYRTITYRPPHSWSHQKLKCQIGFQASSDCQKIVIIVYSAPSHCLWKMLILSWNHP